MKEVARGEKEKKAAKEKEVKNGIHAVITMTIATNRGTFVTEITIVGTTTTVIVNGTASAIEIAVAREEKLPMLVVEEIVPLLTTKKEKKTEIEMGTAFAGAIIGMVKEIAITIKTEDAIEKEKETENEKETETETIVITIDAKANGSIHATTIHRVVLKVATRHQRVVAMIDANAAEVAARNAKPEVIEKEPMKKTIEKKEEATRKEMETEKELETENEVLLTQKEVDAMREVVLEKR